MPPFSINATLKHEYRDLSSTLSYKYVDKSRYEAKNETSTPSYSWLSAYLEYIYKSNSMEGSVFLKAENLTNEQAYNHLSFLKRDCGLPSEESS